MLARSSASISPIVSLRSAIASAKSIAASAVLLELLGHLLVGEFGQRCIGEVQFVAQQVP